ncbi:hypothetical membrane-associated protein [Coxiella burnetii CbuK_Q154]|nr:hypothetical membrane-associated protein [Coxiella burnetii CbuK_Q154]
MPDKTDSLTIL